MAEKLKHLVVAKSKIKADQIINHFNLGHTHLGIAYGDSLYGRGFDSIMIFVENGMKRYDPDLVGYFSCRLSNPKTSKLTIINL